MKRQWEAFELIEHFTLLPSEQEILPSKGNTTAANQLGFAVLLKFFQREGRFPSQLHEVPSSIVSFIAKQLDIPHEQYLQYNWQGRTIKHHRAQIRGFMGFREATLQDLQELRSWLLQYVLPLDSQIEQLKDWVKQRLLKLKLEPPTTEQVERLIRYEASGACRYSSPHSQQIGLGAAKLCPS